MFIAVHGVRVVLTPPFSNRRAEGLMLATVWRDRQAPFLPLLVVVNAARPTTSAPIGILQGSSPAPRTVMVVSKDPGPALPDSSMDANDYDVVLIAPLAHAYSQIKRVRPDQVILCVSFDDPIGFQVLSMLRLDPDTAPIPVLTYAATDAELFHQDALPVDEAIVLRQSTLPASLN